MVRIEETVDPGVKLGTLPRLAPKSRPLGETLTVRVRLPLNPSLLIVTVEDEAPAAGILFGLGVVALIWKSAPTVVATTTLCAIELLVAVTVVM